MITVWPEGCLWPKSVGDWYEKVQRPVRYVTARKVQSPGTYVTERVSRGHLCLALCSFGPHYHMEREGMPLHDTAGIDCKNGATTENRGSAVMYMD